jgi:hypothetical protein
MNSPIMGPHTEFLHRKNRFLAFLSLKAACLIPQLAMRDYKAYLDESSHSYAYALLLHAAGDNMRADQAVRCITAARPDSGTAT